MDRAKIDFETEKEAVRICFALVNKEPSESNGLTLKAIKWLETEELIKDMELTELGELYVLAVKKDSSFDTLACVTKFKEEALTGILCKYNPKSHGIVSKRSPLTKAVLPKQGASKSKGRSPEDMIIEQDNIVKSREQLAHNLEITLDDCQNYMVNGQIKHCNGCDKIGIFDKHSGNRLQHICRKCRIRKRKESRKK